MLDEIRLFVSIVRMGSFSAAGRERGFSPASVSRQISSLETDLGVRLLNRSSRSISATEAGQLFLERAIKILEDIDDMRGRVAELGRVPVGTLNVHARGLIGTHLVVPVVSEFLRLHPAVDMALTLSDDPVDLASRNIDVSIRGPEVKEGGLMMRKIGSSHRVLCASPAYLVKHGEISAPSDLIAHHCLTYRFNFNAPAWSFSGTNGVTSIQIPSKVQSYDGEALRLLALDGAGIALLPFWSVARDISDGRLIQLLPDFQVAPNGASFRYTVYALFQPGRQQSPKLRAFINVLAHSLRRRERAHWLAS